MSATKGPWKLVKDSFGAYVEDEHGNIMHMACDDDKPLISTAPEAIELLRKLVDIGLGGTASDYKAILDKAAVLIARADEEV